MNEVLLKAEGIYKSFGATKAVVDFHIEVCRGTIHGLIGENGSGKSTFSSIVAGIQQRDSGRLLLRGEDYAPTSSVDAAKQGVSLIVQEIGTIGSIPVSANIFLNEERRFVKHGCIDYNTMNAEAKKILSQTGGEHIDPQAITGTLNLEDRKLVEIARGMYSEPELLIIDETSNALAKHGRDILYQNMCAVLGFGMLGLLLYRYLCQKWRGDSRFAQRMTAAVLAFAFLFSVVHIGIGKFGQWYTDSDLVKQDTNALLLKNDLPEGDYRIDTYKIHDNIGMWLDKSCLQYFGSTAAPSILSFYPALGVKRDVRSEPELSNYALRGLLSVEYLITTPEKQTDFENEADDGWEYAFAKDGYAVYRNTNYVPMGFAYDYYLTQTEYEETAKATRANLLMRALVLTDEDAAVYGKYLTHLPEGRREELYYESYVQDCRERRATAASVFQMNNSGFHAEITLEKENLVFFSVPYDDGFTAYVNGQEADIVEVDEGLMAVLCPAGENSIDFVYQPDGIRLSRALTLGGIVVWLAYTAYFVWRKRRTKRA